MSILITRPEPEASIFASLCAEDGFASIKSPLLEIKTSRKEIDLTGVGCLAFTSANGVRAFGQRNTERRLPVFAVGEASGDAARGIGFEIVHVADGDVETLSALIVAQHNTEQGAALHCAGATRAGDLVQMLDVKNVTARREVLYEARPIAALSAAAISGIKADESIDWVALFSPRSASIFVEVARKAGLMPSLSRVRVACLSEAVAEQLGETKWNSVHVAARREASAMLELFSNA